MSKQKIKAGDKLGNLTAIRFDKIISTTCNSKRSKTGKSIRNRKYWIFKCDCGNEKSVCITNAITGNTKSCGCILYPNKLPSGESAKRRLLYDYIHSAARRGLEFKLSKEELYWFAEQRCEYCGYLPKNKINSNNGTFVYNGIDRIDNNVGYTLDNCVTCCITCNRGKHKLSNEEFKLWIKRIVNNN